MSLYLSHFCFLLFDATTAPPITMAPAAAATRAHFKLDDGDGGVTFVTVIAIEGELPIQIPQMPDKPYSLPIRCAATKH